MPELPEHHVEDILYKSLLYMLEQSSDKCVKRGHVTAHFVAPAQFVAGDKMFTLSGTFCRTLHMLSPEDDNMCSRSRHILSPLRKHQTKWRNIQCYLAFGI